jgi:hypothetical protein
MSVAALAASSETRTSAKLCSPMGQKRGKCSLVYAYHELNRCVVRFFRETQNKRCGKECTGTAVLKAFSKVSFY